MYSTVYILYWGHRLWWGTPNFGGRHQTRCPFIAQSARELTTRSPWPHTVLMIELVCFIYWVNSWHTSYISLIEVKLRVFVIFCECWDMCLMWTLCLNQLVKFCFKSGSIIIIFLLEKLGFMTCTELENPMYCIVISGSCVNNKNKSCISQNLCFFYEVMNESQWPHSCYVSVSSKWGYRLRSLWHHRVS